MKIFNRNKPHQQPQSLEELRAAIEHEQREGARAQAEAWAAAQVREGRLLPFEVKGLVDALIQCAVDDLKIPLNGITRGQKLQAIVEARKPHGLFQEMVASQRLPETVAQEADSTGKSKTTKLLQMTAIGQRALDESGNI